MSRWLYGIRVTLRSLVRPRRQEDELDEEFQFHLDRQIDEGRKAGLPLDEARRSALRAMGPIGSSKEECRDVRATRVISELVGDLRYAGRSLRRSPRFAALAIIIMALGIGANTAVFSVVNAVLLEPLPYASPDRIITLNTAFLTAGRTQRLVSIANFRDWRDQSSAFEAMATYQQGDYPVTPGATAEYARAAIVEPDFFRVFDVAPAIGRMFTNEETVPGNRAALISHDYWQRRLDGDPDVLERTVRVRNEPWPIVGVLPAGFQFPRGTDLWLSDRSESTSRRGHNYFAVGRLVSGTSLEQAQAELTAIAAGLARQYPDTNTGRGVTAVRLHDDLVGDVRPTLYLLWGVVGIVLLIACANTATLLLGKATSRTREVAVRTALGASRRRIVRQLLTESLVLSVVAGLAGVLLAYWGARALVALAPADIVRLATTGVDAGVLVFTLIMSVVTSVVFGLVPALHASKVDLTDAVKQGGARGVVGGRMVRTRGALVVCEIALAVVLMTGAGLLVKSLIALHAVELGYQPENVLVMQATRMRPLPEGNAFFVDMLSRVATLPGVVSAGATSVPPGDLTMSGSGTYYIDQLPARPDPTLERPTLMTMVAPGTFAALGVPLRRGRDFTDNDAIDRPLVAIVNEALVRESFAGADPIGRTIFCPFDKDDGMTVVGVVGDTRQRNPGVAPVPECYMPYTQHAYNGNTLNVVIRTVGDPTALAGAVRGLAVEVSPEVPVAFTTMRETLATTVEAPTFRALLFGLFAGLALILALVGVYGVMAYAVEQRSREIGLRMALGASRGAVLRLILEQGLLLSIVGLVFGLLAAVTTARLLATMLFEVQPLDGEVYLAVVVLLGVVTVAAGYLPARRATVIDPMQVLKID
jgi:putative ABC transport system permease protein